MTASNDNTNGTEPEKNAPDVKYPQEIDVYFDISGDSLLIWYDRDKNICIKTVEPNFVVEGLAAIGLVTAEYILKDESLKGDLFIHLSEEEKNELNNGAIKVNYLGVYE